MAEWVASFESLEVASTALDTSKSTAQRLTHGHVEPLLETFLAACVYERDRGQVSALFEALAEGFYGTRGVEGKPLDVERDTSRAITDFATQIQACNQALADGRVDATEAALLASSIADVIRDLQVMRADLVARVAQLRKPS